jgi:hypothetical protein
MPRTFEAFELRAISHGQSRLNMLLPPYKRHGIALTCLVAYCQK